MPVLSWAMQLFIWRPTGVTVDGTTPSSEATALDAATAQRRACLLALGSLAVHERDTMIHVQRRTHALMQAQAAYLQAEGVPVEGIQRDDSASSEPDLTFLRFARAVPWLHRYLLGRVAVAARAEERSAPRSVLLDK